MWKKLVLLLALLLFTDEMKLGILLIFSLLFPSVMGHSLSVLNIDEDLGKLVSDHETF